MTKAPIETWSRGARAAMSLTPKSSVYVVSVAASMITASRSFGEERKNQTISAAKSEPRIRCSFTASTAATM